MKGKAISTNKSYLRLFNRFRLWCEKYKLTSLPALESTILRFITFIVTSLRSSTQINAFLAAISYYHGLNGLELPTRTPRVKLLIEASLREFGRVARKKELGQLGFD